MVGALDLSASFLRTSHRGKSTNKKTAPREGCHSGQLPSEKKTTLFSKKRPEARPKQP